MQNILRDATAGDRSATPWILLLILAGYVLISFLLFSIIAQVIVLPFFNFNVQRSLDILGSPLEHESAKLPMMIIQGVTSLGVFILMPYFFIKKNLNLTLSEFLSVPENVKQPIFMTVIIMFCFMVANSVVIEWNQSIDLPEFLSFFEDWAQSKEWYLEKLTNYLTDFNGFHEFMIGLLVIAVIPAIGEELLFRGLIQNLFNSTLKNPHAAIWITATMFGAFHLQFYGVVPRALLGALFGYMYYWSGHLSIAILGHFVNNGFTLLVLYLSQLEVVDFDPTTTGTSPPFYVVMTFFTIGAVLLFLFRSYYKSKADA